VEHSEKVLGEAFIAHDEPPKVLQPGKESFDLPSPSISPQRATVLRALCPGPPVRRNEFHAMSRQFRIQSVRLVGVVADETQPKSRRATRRRSRRAFNQNYGVFRG